MEKKIEYTEKLTKHMELIFNDKNSPNYINAEELADANNATDFMHVITNIIPTIVYEKLTGEVKSPLDINHIANRLCFQFALREKKKDK